LPGGTLARVVVWAEPGTRQSCPKNTRISPSWSSGSGLLGLSPRGARDFCESMAATWLLPHAPRLAPFEKRGRADSTCSSSWVCYLLQTGESPHAAESGPPRSLTNSSTSSAAVVAAVMERVGPTSLSLFTHRSSPSLLTIKDLVTRLLVTPNEICRE
jgi:hypothetical protein